MLPLPMLLLTSLATASGWERPIALSSAAVLPSAVLPSAVLPGAVLPAAVMGPAASAADVGVESSRRRALPAASLLHDCPGQGAGLPRHWVLPCGVAPLTPELR